VIINSDLIPVVAPIGVGPDGETLNINADTFAAALASALKAKRLLLLTDVEGVLDKNGQLIKSLTTAEAQALIDDGTISAGMIPKIESCMDVIAEGVEGVVIINGKVPHAVLLELFTEHGAGTLIERRRPRSRGR
jgi:acetylglutamate kinase